jgi:hypothetical protein
MSYRVSYNGKNFRACICDVCCEWFASRLRISRHVNDLEQDQRVGFLFKDEKNESYFTSRFFGGNWPEVRQGTEEGGGANLPTIIPLQNF